MPQRVGANMETVRRRNRAAILHYLNDHGPTSRKDMAAAIGLTPAAVTQICAELLTQGLIAETGTDGTDNRAGRKKVLLALDYDACFAYAVNIEPERTTVALSNLNGTLAWVRSLHTDPDLPPERFLAQIVDLCRALAGQLPAGTQPAAVGVGITGIVDRQQGCSVHAYGIWNQPVEVAHILQGRLNVPVWVENNVNAFALAELLYGTGRAHDNLMVVKWGPGVGCALIIDQKIYEGHHAKAAELGHCIVEKNGALCQCGRRGCLETKVSYRALCKILPFDAENFGQVYTQAAGTDRRRQFDEAIDFFARTLVNTATVVAPDRILLTGSLFESETIRCAFIEACAAYDAVWRTRVLWSKLAPKEHYLGPVALAANGLLF